MTIFNFAGLNKFPIPKELIKEKIWNAINTKTPNYLCLNESPSFYKFLVSFVWIKLAIVNSFTPKWLLFLGIKNRSNLKVVAFFSASFYTVGLNLIHKIQVILRIVKAIFIIISIWYFWAFFRNPTYKRLQISQFRSEMHIL